MLYNNVGKYIREKRVNSHISLNKFALNADMEPAALSRFETGKSDIKLMTLARIAGGFNLSLSEFFEEFEKKYQ